MQEKYKQIRILLGFNQAFVAKSLNCSERAARGIEKETASYPTSERLKQDYVTFIERELDYAISLANEVIGLDYQVAANIIKKANNAERPISWVHAVCVLSTIFARLKKGPVEPARVS